MGGKEYDYSAGLMYEIYLTFLVEVADELEPDLLPLLQGSLELSQRLSRTLLRQILNIAKHILWGWKERPTQWNYSTRNADTQIFKALFKACSKCHYLES